MPVREDSLVFWLPGDVFPGVYFLISFKNNMLDIVPVGAPAFFFHSGMPRATLRAKRKNKFRKEYRYKGKGGTKWQGQ